MKDNKRLKDPIYGYVNVPLEYMTDIIDTSSFQRLRRIIQTSYSPLYSSAVHNRFVHSIGVFHLGELASRQLVQEIEKKVPGIEIKKSQTVFMLACLLHDVGHAPFSHTGEQFYLGESGKYGLLHKRLKQCVQNKEFDNDIPINETEAAASHEIMSAIVGLKEFGCFFADDEERALFARCITGYKYQKDSRENQIKNCFVSLLNSNTIDVDKLDYLIRDAYITGFDTVNIDYERLLTALTVINVSDDSDDYQLGYYKSAISVIENVIYAHDSERKWIQSHPVVLYEGYILQHIIADLCRKVSRSGKQLFSEETLSKSGQTFADNVKVNLLCDDDIVYLMKNVYPSDISSEFFERRSRRHPLWKSEAEYKALITSKIGKGTVLNKFEIAMEDTAKYLVKNTDSGVIDESLIKKIEQELLTLKALETTILDSKTKKVQQEKKTEILKVMKCLKEFADESGIDCNFVILKASQFISGFGKADFSNANIVFQASDGEVHESVEIVASLDAKERERKSFFYLFYKRSIGANIELDCSKLCSMLLKEFI